MMDEEVKEVLERMESIKKSVKLAEQSSNHYYDVLEKSYSKRIKEAEEKFEKSKGFFKSTNEMQRHFLTMYINKEGELQTKDNRTLSEMYYQLNSNVIDVMGMISLIMVGLNAMAKKDGKQNEGLSKYLEQINEKMSEYQALNEVFQKAKQQREKKEKENKEKFDEFLGGMYG